MTKEPAQEPVNAASLDIDPTLARLVRDTNRSHHRIAITLQMHGLLVSGLLVSARDYVEALGQTLDASAEKYGSPAKWKMAFNAEKVEEPPKDYVPSFIHLFDVTFSPPSADARSVLIVWRGRLSQVDAWFVE